MRLAEPRRGDEQFSVGAPRLSCLRRCRASAKRSLQVGVLSSIAKQALVAADQRARGV